MASRPVPAARRNKPDSISASTTISSPSTGLLINVIRTLTISASEEQRLLEKRRLEQGHAESEAAIEKLLKVHQKDVDVCLETFRHVTHELSVCRERVARVRNALSSCRALVERRLADLHKLWRDTAQHQAMAESLTELEECVDAAGRAATLAQKGDLVSAAAQIARSDELLNSRFAALDALADLRAQLSHDKKMVTDATVAELLTICVAEPFEEQLANLAAQVSAERLSDLVASGSVSPQLAGLHGRLEHERQHRKSTQELGLIFGRYIEALASLGRVSAGAEGLRAAGGSALWRQMVATASLIRHVRSSANLTNLGGPGESEDQQPQLVELADLVVAQLDGFCARCSQLGAQLARLDDSARLTEWAQAQAQDALVQLVSEHVGISSSRQANNSAPSAAVTASATRLFRFDSAAAALASAAATSHHAQNSLLVSPPAARNLVSLYPAVARFANRVETAAKSSDCQLSKFLTSFVAEVLVVRVKTETSEKIDAALQAADAHTALVAPTARKKILASVHHLAAQIDELARLAAKLPPYAANFGAFWLLLLKEAADHFERLYERTTALLPSADDDTADSSQGTSQANGNPAGGSGGQQRPGRRRKTAAAWAADDDISRLLRSLPNFARVDQQLQNEEETENGGDDDDEDEVEETGKGANAKAPLGRSAAEEALYARETKLLMSNVTAATTPQMKELIGDASTIRLLAVLHASLVWLAGRTRQAVASLPSETATTLQASGVSLQNRRQEKVVKENVLVALADEAKRLDALALGCLLCVHIEVRLHVFAHLMPLGKTLAQRHQTAQSAANDSLDEEVTALGHELSTIRGALTPVLSAVRLRYVLDGLGHLAAAIFIHLSEQLGRLSETARCRLLRNIWGVKQVISAASGRAEPALDRAQRFYELLTTHPDDLVRQPPTDHFSPQELQQLVALAVRSHAALSAQPGALDKRMEKLRAKLDGK